MRRGQNFVIELDGKYYTRTGLWSDIAVAAWFTKAQAEEKRKALALAVGGTSVKVVDVATVVR